MSSPDDAISEYTKIVALCGADSPLAVRFREKRKDDEEFPLLARLADFFLTEWEAAEASP